MSELVHVQTLLKSPATLATVLHVILRHKYGHEVYSWDPTTVYLELKDDFQIDPPSELIDRFAAIQTLMTSDVFFKRVDAFSAINNALAGNDPSFDIFDPPTAEEMAWGISEAALNRDMLEFSYPVQQLVQITLNQDGYDHDAPEVFDFVLKPEDKASVRTVLRQLYKSPNEGVIETYISEQLRELAAQLAKIPELANIDAVLSDSAGMLNVATL